MKPTILCAILANLFVLFLQAQEATNIAVPMSNDKYANYIQQLETGTTEIDYQDFRFSFLESPQFLVVSENFEVLVNLKKLIRTAIAEDDDEEVIRLAREILNIDYLDLQIMKLLSDCYNEVGDDEKSDKYLNILGGLLKSIVGNSDGLSCEQAWKVIRVPEEYFVLSIMGAKFEKQSVVHDAGVCDKMDVVTENGEKVSYYFDVSKVFESYDKLLAPKN